MRSAKLQWFLAVQGSAVKSVESEMVPRAHAAALGSSHSGPTHRAELQAVYHQTSLRYTSEIHIVIVLYWRLQAV